MMGRKLVPRERTERINLEEFVPQDHLLRVIDRYLDLTAFREHLKPFYSHIGRPSVDPDATAVAFAIARHGSVVASTA